MLAAGQRRGIPGNRDRGPPGRVATPRL